MFPKSLVFSDTLSATDFEAFRHSYGYFGIVLDFRDTYGALGGESWRLMGHYGFSDRSCKPPINKGLAREGGSRTHRGW